MWRSLVYRARTHNKLTRNLIIYKLGNIMIHNKDDHLPLLYSLPIITVLHDTNEKIDPLV
jgi:hypothetical protein